MQIQKYKYTKYTNTNTLGPMILYWTNCIPDNSGCMGNYI